jgi:hypothetical protein
MTKMHAEIVRSINFYRSQQAGEAPTLVLLAGGTSIIPYTDTFLKEKLNVVVDYLNPFNNVTVHASIPAEQIGRSAHVLGQVVGLALRRRMPCPIELDLMPPARLADRAFRRKQPMFVMAMLGVILTVGVWAVYFLKMAQLAHERSQKVSEQVGRLSGVESRLAAAEKRSAEVDGKLQRLLALTAHRAQWVDVLTQIRTCMPDGMTLVSLHTEGAVPSGAPGEVPAPLAPGATPPAADEIRALEAKGFIYLDKIEDKAEDKHPVRLFRDALREQVLFSNRTEVVSMPAPSDYAQEFAVQIILKQPLRP